MYYLFIGTIIIFYFYQIEQYKIANKKYLWLLFIPPMYMYWIGLALQYNVGQDYFSYIDIYTNSNRLDHYLYNHEYGFYFLIQFLKYFNLGSQSIFASIGLIQTILLFLILYIYNRHGFKIWLIFLLFFTVSTIYHNQMNALRQFIAILSTPIFFLYIFEKKYLKSLMIVFFALSFHNSFIIVLLISLIIYTIRNFNKYHLFILSLMMPFIYLFIFPLFVYTIIEFVFPQYSHYIGGFVFNIQTLLTKAYYLPFIIYFWYLYLNKNLNIKLNMNFFHFSISILSLTYCIYLTDLTIPMYGRIMQYFQFFYIFPLYYIVQYHISRKKIKSLIFILFLIIFPYFLKVTAFQISEYHYESIIFI